MNKTIKWRPDTCGCVINYAYDGSLPPELQVMTLDSIESKCVKHEKLDNEVCYTKVKGENSLKNVALGEVKGVHPSKESTYRFDEKRNVVVRVETITTTEKADLQKLLDDKLGKGRVTVE